MNDVIIELAKFKENLQLLMNPEVLSLLVELLRELGGDKRGFAEQYKYWIEKNGKDCRYAAMAKAFFENDNATNVATKICDLYHSWAKCYEKGETNV